MWNARGTGGTRGEMIQFLVEALELDIPTKPKFLLVCLCDSADMYGVCYPSMATLSRRTSMPERTLQRQLKWLVEHGIVSTFWNFTDKMRHRKIQHYRLVLESVARMPEPDFSNCTPGLRAEVIARFQHVCSYCGERGDAVNGPGGAPWHVDRIVPGSRGGKYIASNVTLSCRSCNSRKGAKEAPSNVRDLGAILNIEGCQNGQSVVPNRARNKEEPSLNHQEPVDGIFESLKTRDEHEHDAGIRKAKALGFVVSEDGKTCHRPPGPVRRLSEVSRA